MWKKIAIAVIALVLLAAVLNRTIGDRLVLQYMQKQVVANLSGARFAEFPDGLKVTSFAVDHAPITPAVGYRFDYKGRSAVLSGDTRKSANLAQFAKGADLLVHEALSPELVGVLTAGAKEAGVANIEQITRDILNYHTTPVEAAEIAEAAGVKQLLYYHLVPALPIRRLEPIFLRGVSDVYKGGVTVGQDRSWIALPANSNKVIVGRRNSP